MEMQCGRQFHPNGTITVFAKLMLPDSPGLIEAIDKFIAIPTLIDIANQPAPPIDDTYSQITVYTHVRYYIYIQLLLLHQPMRVCSLCRQISLSIYCLSMACSHVLILTLDTKSM